MFDPKSPARINLLFVCSAAMLRSPTAAHLFASKGYNTRCAGTDVFALQLLNDGLMEWAHKIYCMEIKHYNAIPPEYREKVQVLNIPDLHDYRDPDLIDLLEARVELPEVAP